MSKRFRVCSLDQDFLLPPSLQDWLPEDHLARFIADVVNQLDLSAIYDRPDPYWLFVLALCGVRSSIRIRCSIACASTSAWLQWPRLTPLAPERSHPGRHDRAPIVSRKLLKDARPRFPGRFDRHRAFFVLDRELP